MKNNQKNRMKRQAAGLGMAALLGVASMGGSMDSSVLVQAAQEEVSPLILTQKAEWTQKDLYQGKITLELSGLLKYKEGIGETGREMPPVEPSTVESTTESVPEYADAGTSVENAENPDSTDGTDSVDGTSNADGTESPGDAGEIQNGEEIEEAVQENMENLEIAEGAVNVIAESQEMEVSQISDGGETEAADEFTDQEENKKLYLTDYISEYFQLETKVLDEDYSTEAVAVMNQKGEQTTITKVTRSITLEEVTEDTITMELPVTLRQEYQILEKAMKYPVSQDDPLQKDQKGAGAFVKAGTGETEPRLAETGAPLLEAEAAKTDFSMDLRLETGSPKAGQPVAYALEIVNTGKLPLSNLYLTSVTCKEGVAGEWEAETGVEINGNQACLLSLPKGETRVLKISVPLTEETSGTLRHTVSAEMKTPGQEGETMKQEVSMDVKVASLKAEFTVEKTADRTEAEPGDTITYQICIRNTGERTIHSVLSTERFLNANIHAQFVEKEGVILNGSKTQALISQIAPGEAFALQAKVNIPQNFSSQELINQVQVTTKETGSQTVQSQAGVTILGTQLTATPTVMLTGQGMYQSGSGTKSSGTGAYSTSTQPKTGDDSPLALFVALLCCCSLSIPGVFLRWKAKSRH